MKFLPYIYTSEGRKLHFFNGWNIKNRLVSGSQ